MAACPTCLKVFVYQQNGLNTGCCKECALIEVHILFLLSLGNILDAMLKDLIRATDVEMPKYTATPLQSLIDPGKNASADAKDLAQQLKDVVAHAPTTVAATARALPVWLPVQPVDHLAAATSRDVCCCTL